MGSAIPPTVLLTRPHSDSHEMAQVLRLAGLRVLTIPCINVIPLLSAQSEIRTQLARCPWVILTSQNALKALIALLGEVETKAALKNKQIAVVGPSTALALQSLGLTATIIPTKAHVQALSETLQLHWKDASPQTALWLCGTLALTQWIDAFEQTPHQITPLVVYETQPATGILPTIQSELEALWQPPQPVALTFASPSAVIAWCQIHPVFPLPSHVHVFSIGPRTTEAVQSQLNTPSIEASPHTAEGLTQAVLDWAALWYNQNTLTCETPQ